MLDERDSGEQAETGALAPTADQLAGEVVALVADWLPPGRTVASAVDADRVVVTIDRVKTEERPARTWRTAHFVGDLRREGAVARAAGSSLHNAGLEVAAFRVWRGERPTSKPAEGAAQAGPEPAP